MLAQIVLFDGFDPLDVIAPFEVLGAGSDLLRDDSLEVRLVGIQEPGAVVSGTRDLRLVDGDRPAHHSLNPIGSARTTRSGRSR